MAIAKAIPTVCSFISFNRLFLSEKKNKSLETQKLKQRRLEGVASCCSREAENSIVNERVSRTLVLERYNNETAKRYVLDMHSMVQIVDEVHKEMISDRKNGSFMAIHHPRFPSIIKEFILPAGYPASSLFSAMMESVQAFTSYAWNVQTGRSAREHQELASDNGSVSDDYLEYMLWQFPTNVTAWICKTLVTSSLLKAVGIGSWTGSTAAASAIAALEAAIKWVSKDGFGAIGRLVIGGRFGGLFDDDPKQWRMYADFVGSLGSILELATPLVPGHFLPLASLGNLTKAIAKGLKDPSFRVIQNHFAVYGNLGDVAAKEEVWEVAGELVGLAIGITLIATPGLLNSYPKLALTWTSLRLLHLWLRYQSLSVLRFSTINLKRARLLVESHVSGSPIPDFVNCNQQENILIFQELLKPHIRFGCSLEMLIGRNMSGNELEALLDLYKNEKYVLMVTTNPLHGHEARIAFKVGATPITVLRSIWQTYWLSMHGELFNGKNLQKGSFLSSQDKVTKESSNLIHCLTESLLKLDATFDDFLSQVENAGWDVKHLSLKVPTKVTIIENGIQ